MTVSSEDLMSFQRQLTDVAGKLGALEADGRQAMTSLRDHTHQITEVRANLAKLVADLAPVVVTMNKLIDKVDELNGFRFKLLGMASLFGAVGGGSLVYVARAISGGH